MKREILEDFSGFLSIKDNNQLDTAFRVHNNIVTMLPLTDECKKEFNKLSYNDGSNEKDHWLFGICEDNSCIAFLKKTHLTSGFSSGNDLSASKFSTPLIIKNTTTDNLDLSTFDSIEFYGGIVDILHIPDLAIDDKISEQKIEFKTPESYTRKYNVNIDNEDFEIEYSISAYKLTIEAGKIPDLREQIHSFLRFNFKTEQQLCKIEKYYSYAMNLFQFCSGKLNVNSEVRLYKKGKTNPILLKIHDGFDDYANDILNFTKVIRFQFLDNNFPTLIKILNEDETRPYLMFLSKRNKHINSITYTDISDLCTAFEVEYSLLNIATVKKEKEAAKTLTKELLEVINKTDYASELVKEKARNILNSQLKSFSPSLKEKIITIYDEFSQYLKKITELQLHIKLGISKSYTRDKFIEKISEFVLMRNKAAHAGIVWNEGVEIFYHLQLLIYFCILKRAGYSYDCSCSMLSWLFSGLF